ncbi:hypothetical protein Tco_0209105 [Tanacetum coccineum]
MGISRVECVRYFLEISFALYSVVSSGFLGQYLFRCIQNGNSKEEISTGKDGVVRVLSPVTAAEIQAVEKERKAKRTVFKQQFEAFKISNSEGLEKGYDRFQQLLSQLEAHGAEVLPKTSSSAQNVAFVSQSKSSTNKVKSGAYSSCTPSTSSTNNPKKEVLAGFADEVIYSLFAKQTEDLDLLHEDLEQIDE